MSQPRLAERVSIGQYSRGVSCPQLSLDPSARFAPTRASIREGSSSVVDAERRRYMSTDENLIMLTKEEIDPIAKRELTCKKCIGAIEAEKKNNNK